MREGLRWRLTAKVEALVAALRRTAPRTGRIHVPTGSGTQPSEDRP
jgi:hypothetical protein